MPWPAINEFLGLRVNLYQLEPEFLIIKYTKDKSTLNIPRKILLYPYGQQIKNEVFHYGFLH